MEDDEDWGTQLSSEDLIRYEKDIIAPDLKELKPFIANKVFDVKYKSESPVSFVDARWVPSLDECGAFFCMPPGLVCMENC